MSNTGGPRGPPPGLDHLPPGLSRALASHRHSSPGASPSSAATGSPAPHRSSTMGSEPGAGGGARSAQQQQADFDAKRLRKAFLRRTVDYNSGVILHNQMRTQLYPASRSTPWPAIQPDMEFLINLLPPYAIPDKPVSACTTRFVHTSMNKYRTYVNVVRWTPEGRRLITGSASGEFTLWNGLTFNFETILQAHETSVRSMRWSRNDTWMLSGDNAGVIKYWQSNMNNLKSIQVHKEAVRGIAFAPSDAKFATCSDDKTVKVWNFHTGACEHTMLGHGWDVKCLDWHPYKAMIASGSKDNLIKLWDPRAGRAITTLHGHKNTIHAVQWNRNGNWLLSGSRDQMVKIFDIRTMKEYANFKGHAKEVCSVAWHPQHEDLFVSGGSEGSLIWWLASQPSIPLAQVPTAHDANIWALDWHPLGHILCTGSNDYATRFWTRPRPGESELAAVAGGVREVTGTDARDADYADHDRAHHQHHDQDDFDDNGEFYIPGFGTIGGTLGGDDAPMPPSSSASSRSDAPWRASSSASAGMPPPPGLDVDPDNMDPDRLEREMHRKRRREMFDDFFGPNRRGPRMAPGKLPPMPPFPPGGGERGGGGEGSPGPEYRSGDRVGDMHRDHGGDPRFDRDQSRDRFDRDRPERGAPGGGMGMARPPWDRDRDRDQQRREY
ncbi:hypothetical protein GGF31_004312 [Allomyces arbusculus]|nr:hypothetical protein GGF31_004312 [Allomyces arbusculus]